MYTALFKIKLQREKSFSLVRTRQEVRADWLKFYLELLKM